MANDWIFNRGLALFKFSCRKYDHLSKLDTIKYLCDIEKFTYALALNK